MVKKKGDEVEVVSIAKDFPVCQNCKSHRNNPSFCRLKAEHTGRKETCDDFKK